MENTGSQDPSYEYNCPQFVDFSMPIEHNDNADEYFNFDHEQGDLVNLDLDEKEFSTPSGNGPMRDSGINSTMGMSPSNKSTKQESPDKAVSPLPETSQAETVKDTEEDTAMDCEAGKPAVKKTSNGVLSNIVTSLTAWRSRGGTVTDPGACAPAAPTGSGAAKFVRKNARSPRGRSKRAMSDSCSQPVRGPADSPVAKKRRPLHIKAAAAAATATAAAAQPRTALTPRRGRSSTVNTPVRGPAVVRHDRSLSGGRRQRGRTLSKPGTPLTTRSRTMSQERCVLNSSHQSSRGRLSGSVERKQGMPAIKPKLTMPKTPTCLKRTQKGPQQHAKTSEQLEMERIQHFKKEMAKKRKQAAESHLTVQNSTGYAPVRSAQPLTRPAGFTFATDDRIKDAGDDAKNDAERDFVAGLRAHPASPTRNVHKGPTKTKPFHFAERKRKRADKSEERHEFHSVAETVIAFANKTPERFRTRRAGAGRNPSPSKRAKTDRPHLTMPKTPHFETRRRHRETTVKSQAQRDEEELEELKRYKFHAKPINEQIFKQTGLGVKAVQPKESTKPEGFDLEADRRIHHRRELRQAEKHEEQFKFKANPVPKDILERTTGLKPVKGLPLTVPESPAFALKNRVRSHLKDIVPDIPEEEKKVIRHHPVPHTGLAFQPKIDHRVTEMQPFSFDERDRTMMAKKEQKIQKVLQEEVKTKPFRANRIPPASPDVLPHVPHKSATRPEPFELECDMRGQQKAEEWSHKIKKEEQEQQAMANFKANPNNLLYQQPFVPKKSCKMLTDVSDFELNTERRAEKRDEWETWRKTRDLQEQAEQAAVERKRQEDEREEIAQLRKDLVHKPNPVRHYKGVEVQPSSRPVTSPHTPRFSERLRTRAVRY